MYLSGKRVFGAPAKDNYVVVFTLLIKPHLVDSERKGRRDAVHLSAKLDWTITGSRYLDNRYAENCYAENRYAENRYAENRYTDIHSTDNLYKPLCK